jgi:hypothetical protein
MKRTARIHAACLLVGGVSAVSPAFAGTGASGGGSATSGYNAIPASVNGNVPSVGFQATQTTEFGDEVVLSGKNRTLNSMTVLFSSWACQTGAWETNDCTTTPGATFPVDITFNVYADSAGTPGAVLATKTQTVNIAYRPSASAICATISVGGIPQTGKWYNKADKTCYNGFPQTVKMSMASATLDDNVIWSVNYPTYNTNGGVTGPADSLNVGANTFASAPFSGTDTNEDQAFRNGVMESGWTGYRPLGAITTVK